MINKSLLYCFLQFFVNSNIIGQDFIVKKDSSRLAVDLIEITPTEIKYRFFNYPNGPFFVKDNTDIAYLIFKNGSKQIIKTENDQELDVKNKSKIGNYIKFNVQLGMVIHNAYCNKRRIDDLSGRSYTDEYYGYTNKNYANVNIGINLLLGKNDYLKHVIGLNYLRSKGDFNYKSGGLSSASSFGGWDSNSEDYRYTSEIDFINIVTGIRTKIGNKIHFETCIVLNINAHENLKITGTSTKTHNYDTRSNLPPVVETTFINKQTSSNKQMNATVSFCPKIEYDFSLKKQKLSVYFSYNFGFEYRLPWCMFGFTYYPFKKLQ